MNQSYTPESPVGSVLLGNSSSGVATQEATEIRKPYGFVTSGREGISATRLAEALGISLKKLRKLAQPIGTMKMPRRSEFQVYDPGLIDTLAHHPAVLHMVSRKRRSPENSRRAAQARRERCVAQLSQKRPDLKELFRVLVERMWSPSTEARLLQEPFYREVPALLWDALAPKPECEVEAKKIIVNTVWAAYKSPTWKVNREWKGQDLPLVFDVWSRKPDVSTEPETYENVFAASIRHAYFNHLPIPKDERRGVALQKLNEISTRLWPSRIAEVAAQRKAEEV